MARRYVNKAGYEWRKLSYLSQAEKRYGDALERLKRRRGPVRGDHSRDKLRRARTELQQALGQVRAEERLDHDGIDAYYEKAERICDLVIAHYETGAYHEASFSQKREKLLHRLDSLTAAERSALLDRSERAIGVTMQENNVSAVTGIDLSGGDEVEVPADD